MGGIGRRYKRKMQGTSSYVKAVASSPTPHPPSVKRKRLKYKRNGGADTAIKRTIAHEMEQCAQPLSISLRHAIYPSGAFDILPPSKWFGIYYIRT